MSRVLVLNKSVCGLSCDRERKRSANFGSRFSMGKNFGRAQINLVSLTFFALIAVGLGGAFYLYQVNDIATKGYEVRDLQNQIQDLQKESKKMEIREVELRSMYNIEKSSQDLNLVNSANVSYVEINGPVAMK